MASITIQRELPAEFLSDILITAFDGAYGWSWNWFESTERKDIYDGSQSLELSHRETCNWKIEDGRVVNCHCDVTEQLWLKVGVRLRSEHYTDNNLFDTPDGFTVDHDTIAAGISRIINDDYIGIWREANQYEKNYVQGAMTLSGEIHGRRWKKDESKGILVETGETARGYQEDLSRIIAGLESGATDAGDIDAPFADAIVQVGIFGKCIFS